MGEVINAGWSCLEIHVQMRCIVAKALCRRAFAAMNDSRLDTGRRLQDVTKR